MMLSLQCCALRQFKVTDGQNMHGQIKSDKRPNAHEQIAFCTFHLLLILNEAGYIHAVHAW